MRVVLKGSGRMGYDLHITRKKHWAFDEGPSITTEEWLAIVHNDPELNIDAQNGPYFTIWSGPGEYPCWIDYSDGDLFSKYPTEEFIEKMVQIANVLGGKVQGDDGEIYPGGGQLPYEE